MLDKELQIENNTAASQHGSKHISAKQITKSLTTSLLFHIINPIFSINT